MKRLMKSFVRLMLCVTVVLPSLVSCGFDDSALWETIGQMKKDIDALKEDLNGQIAAINAMMREGLTIRSCEQKNDGSYKVTLSDGTKFTLLPEGTDFSSLITYKYVDGNKCWATFDAKGVPTPLLDAENKPIRVEEQLPEVTERDGVYYIVIGGEEYKTGYNTEDIVQIFRGYDVNKDASGNVYSMTFTFGENLSFTATVDGYKGVIFRMADAVSDNIITDYFVDYGTTASVRLDKAGVVDYVMQVPDGWRVKERDEVTGESYLDITAPSKELIASGAAVVSGDLKLVAVVEGGKAAISKLVLSVDPFELFRVSATMADIKVYAGVPKFAYGLVVSSGYNEADILTVVSDAVTSGSELPSGFAISDRGYDVSVGLSDVLGAELSIEENYVFWAVPVFYAAGENAGYYVAEGTIESYQFGAISVKIGEPAAGLLDAQISVSVNGTDGFYGGTALKSEELFDDIIYKVNNSIIDPFDAPLNYSGSAMAFMAGDSDKSKLGDPESTYVTWVIPVEPDKDEYDRSDIIFKEFTTKSVRPAASESDRLTLTIGEPEVSCNMISMPVSCDDAAMIYFAYLANDRNANSSNETKFQKIIENETFTVVKASEADAVIDHIRPGTNKYLYAVAINSEGEYGNVVNEKGTTLPIEYSSSLKIDVDVFELGAKGAKLRFTAAGGQPSDIVYWIGASDEAFWNNASMCNKNQTQANEYLALYPEDERILRAMNTYGEISEDGVLNVTGLNMETSYVALFVARDASGRPTNLGYAEFKTLAADLGTIVREGSEQWNAARNSINIDWIEEAYSVDEEFASYAFDFSCDKNLTAYVMCAAKNYFEGDPKITKVEQEIIYVENYCSRKYDFDPPTFDENGNPLQEPSRINEDGELVEGQLASIWRYYVHGLPDMGFVTYFAEGTHGEGNCTSWEAGKCSNYQRALERIAAYQTIEPYYDRADNLFGLSGEAALKWANELLALCKPYYENAVPMIFINDGSAVRINSPNALGPDDSGVVMDELMVVFKDKAGNYYEPMLIPVEDHFPKVE